MNPQINLVVLRVSDLAVSERFYSRLGITFVREKHDNGPEHLAATLQGVTLELYPVGKTNTAGIRLGLAVASLADVLVNLETVGGSIVSSPHSSEWGVRAVILDPDGHTIELLERVAT